uniref:hypothetical protein n=1 Tax=Escherichia albertii TaxID=208962 RepID=UPI001CAA3ED9
MRYAYQAYAQYIEFAGFVGRIRRSRRIRHEQSARCQHSETDAKSVGFFMSILSDDRLNWPR